MKKIRIPMGELKDLANERREFPKYVSPIINLANQFAQGTRPRVVGQLSDLIQECPYRTYEGWEKWYLAKKPEAIANATNRIIEMLESFRAAMPRIDEGVVRQWVEDLVLIGAKVSGAYTKKDRINPWKGISIVDSRSGIKGN